MGVRKPELKAGTGMGGYGVSKIGEQKCEFGVAEMGGHRNGRMTGVWFTIDDEYISASRTCIWKAPSRWKGHSDGLVSCCVSEFLDQWKEFGC